MVARLEQNDRFDTGGRAQGAHELAGMAHALDVQQDVAGLLVGNQIIEDFPEINIHCRPERNDRRDADLVHGGPVEHGGTHGAGLGDQRQIAGLGDDLGKGGVQRNARANDAQRFWPQNTDPEITRRIADAPFVRRAAAAHTSRVGDDDQMVHAGLAALLDDQRNGARRGGDNRQINAAADLLDTRQASLPEDFTVLGIDRPKLALEAAGQNVLQDDMADGAGLFRGANDRQ